MSPEHLAWLASLPLTLELAVGVLAFHGSPSDDLTYLLETVEQTGARAATHDEVLERLGDVSGWSLLLCGHTHLQREMRLPSGTLVVNPGSVGWPAYADNKPQPARNGGGHPSREIRRYSANCPGGGRLSFMRWSTTGIGQQNWLNGTLAPTSRMPSRTGRCEAQAARLAWPSIPLDRASVELALIPPALRREFW